MAFTPNSSPSTRIPSSVPAKGATLERRATLMSGLDMSSAVYTTSSAVTGCPSCHLAFLFRLNVILVWVSSSMDQESARRGLKDPSAFTTISLSKISSSTASVLALVVLKGIRVSHGAVMAMVTIFCPWEAVFSWALPSALPSALASPPTAAVPVAAGALVSLGAEGAEQPDSPIIRHRARAVIFVKRFLITISSFLFKPFRH